MCWFFFGRAQPALLLMDHLPNCIRNVCPDSNIAAVLSCGRTKAKTILTKKIAPFAEEKLASKLRNINFSLIVDETTDISTTSAFALVSRYYDNEYQTVKDEDIIGFGSEHAANMVGVRKGVQALMRKDVPNLFVLCCTSHSMHTCVANACKVLPKK